MRSSSRHVRSPAVDACTPVIETAIMHDFGCYTILLPALQLRQPMQAPTSF
jgi:hypothetical protein